MSVKVYAELTIITEFHRWSYHNEEAPNARSCAFTLDHLYLNTDLTNENQQLKKNTLNDINEGLLLSESKVNNALKTLKEEVQLNNGVLLPFTVDAMFDATKILSNERRLDKPLSVDIIWSQPLTWRLFSLFNKSQYLTVAAFYARENKTILPKNFRNHYKAMMNRPLTHALHQISHHCNKFINNVKVD